MGDSNTEEIPVKVTRPAPRPPGTPLEEFKVACRTFERVCAQRKDLSETSIQLARVIQTALRLRDGK